MDAKSREHLEQLPQDEKDELCILVEGIENQDYERAMKTIQDSQEPIPEGYNFSHYVVRRVGNGQTTSNPKGAIQAINEGLDGHRLEVTALLKNPQYGFPDDRENLERSILYVNSHKGALFLDGEEISGKVDSTKVLDVIMSYQK